MMFHFILYKKHIIVADNFAIKCRSTAAQRLCTSPVFDLIKITQDFKQNLLK